MKFFVVLLKKSQYRTYKIRHELLDDNYNANNLYKQSDFILVFKSNIGVYYNSKEQILNVLKENETYCGYKHEIEFYQEIRNSFPFICKIFGKTEKKIQLFLNILKVKY